MLEQIDKGLQAGEHPMLGCLLIKQESEHRYIFLDRGHDVPGDNLRHAGEGSQMHQPI
jgi:hypothetical protein